jgi:hypothetical protein
MLFHEDQERLFWQSVMNLTKGGINFILALL